jgi:asparagine synthase (glutamine-hydrolysing)
VSAIAGLWRFDGKPDTAAQCSRILGALGIYGPHDAANWSNGKLALGRSLFRLLPEDAYDQQPLINSDGRLALVADARLDNREELIGELGLAPSDARKFSDAAILLTCIERWNEDAINRLVGDFAFALWNEKAQTLLLTRDFVGQRPLYYYQSRDFFAFATMPKGLHALSEIPRAPDEEMVAEFLTVMPQSGSRSFFKDIKRVEPGHIVRVTRDQISSRRYWQPRRPSRTTWKLEECVEGLRYHLDQAVQSRLRGTRELIGSNLSSGIDSGAVTATAARLLAANGGKVVAFTAVPSQGYDGPSPRNRYADEGPLAAIVAATYPNIEHVLIRSEKNSPLDGIDRGFYLYEQPLLSLSNTRWIEAINSSARSRKLKVMLIGQFGNMTISYNGLETLPELLRAGRLFDLCKTAHKLVANSNMRWRGVAAQTFGSFLPLQVTKWLNSLHFGHFPEVEEYSILRSKTLRDMNLTKLAGERGLDFSYRPWNDGFAMRVWGMQRSDNGNINKGTLAGWGIDRRDPTADKRLVEYCLSIPTEMYLTAGVQRAVSKTAFADRLPHAILHEQNRGYQAADWHEGLTAAQGEIETELARLAAFTPTATLLDIERMVSLIKNLPSTGWNNTDVIQHYRLALLRGVSAGHFLRRSYGGNQ